MRSKVVIIAFTIFIISGSILFDGCRKNEMAVITTPISINTPPGFHQPNYNFSANPLSEEGFQLGKRLFFDGRLSKDGQFACGSCHQPIAAFTTFEHDRSHGYNNSHTLRNAPGLFNLAWQPDYNRDGGETSLDVVIEKHITHPNEMAETLSNVINKLSVDTTYKRMFASAYGSTEITKQKIFNALTQFVISLVSADSKYDKVKRGTAAFTAEEQNGYAVFQNKCATCHTEPLFTDNSFRNAGLPADPVLKDYGRMRVTGSKADSLKFRVPSLRNVEATSYYTHDGRFSVMRMMVQHYRSGIVPSNTLDPLLVNGIQLSSTEEDNVVAFLRTLTDTAFINNSRYKQ